MKQKIWDDMGYEDHNTIIDTGGVTYPSEKYEFVSWDDDIPNIWENKKCFQTTNQTYMDIW